ncbi:hypothetical protein [Naasia sp. SYSU D00948]|uniref:hypothetical protein n=1 Tax=Naasia sp. SYSU D00948 TaxID=2817379 RepID=UPI001B318898|nr:hypothetical protein [Naasia sp. SYSU D00948]
MPDAADPRLPIDPLPPWALEERLLRESFRRDLLLEPGRLFPFFRPCRNRVLLVADGGLDFSEADFGLSVFVRTLLNTPGRYVRHEITLAHISDVDASRLLAAEPRIARRIPAFRFDVGDHFAPDRYDFVMLFGIATAFGPRGTAADGSEYPADRLADTELQALTAYMDGGGGLFATGDHGALGRALSGAVPRVRNMRLWSSTSAQEEFDAVSMGGPRRNDTNRGGLFNDQSDDVPQVIAPKMYAAGHFFRISYPHPLLCGPRGVIRVMPDHPHEGECVEPTDTSQNLPSGGPEYPPATDGGSRPLPEVISMSTVPSGNRGGLPSGDKRPTHAQIFGGICAYDGHRAGVGRAITDATWHHFVNINLVGMVTPDAPEFDKGFLGSLSGLSHLEDIRAYFRNLAVWGTRAERIRCMNTRLALDIVFDGHVLEAVLTTSHADLAELSPFALKLVGVHARDALGRRASQCQSFRLVLDLVLQRAIPDLVPDVDPWRPDRKERPETTWVDGSALADIALGAALVELRRRIGDPTPDRADIDEDEVAEVMARGADRGVELALRTLEEELSEVRDRFRR